MKFFLVLLTATTASYGQLIDGPYRPGPGPDQLQERAYLEYDYVDTPNDFDDRGNLQFVGKDPVVVDGPVTRNKDRVSSLRTPLRSGPELPGVIAYDEAGYGHSYYGSCRPRPRAHEKYCDLFVETSRCYDGERTISCPNGLVYTGSGRSGQIGVCDFPHMADCFGKEMYNPPERSEHCDWLYGIFGHETSCTRYWTCWNGTATEQFCIGGLLYNEDTHVCDWPENVSGCQKHPLCKDDANGNVPLGKSCNRYWSCQGGYPRLQRCPARLVFDRERKRCVAPPTSDCDVPPPLPQEEEEGGGNQGNDNNERPIRQRTDDGENRRRFQGGGPPQGAADRKSVV